MAKVISKKKQVEIILDSLKEVRKLESKIDDIFEGTLDKYGGKVFDIGYEVIPAILGVPYTDNYGDAHEQIGELFFQYTTGDITKREFWKQVNMYLSKED